MFLKEAIEHYAIECASVLYALFYLDKRSYTSKNLAIADFQIAKKDCDNITVSKQDIQAAVALRRIIKTNACYGYNNLGSKVAYNGLAEFLKIAPPNAFKRCLRLLMEYNMISWWASEAAEEALQKEKEKDRRKGCETYIKCE